MNDTNPFLYSKNKYDKPLKASPAEDFIREHDYEFPEEVKREGLIY
jgi:hypothetical protein